jgi:hypothetical protein
MFFATFVLGLVTGAIIFLQSSTGGEGDGSLDTDTRSFSIVAYVYGGCERVGCPSYRVLQNGSYIYIQRQQGNGKYEGTVSEASMKELKQQLASADFSQIGASTFTGTCPITYDGVAYRFNIDYKGNQYTFDSCVESLEAPLFGMLTKYFEEFNATHVSEQE